MGRTGPRQARIPEAGDEPGIETKACAPFPYCGARVLTSKLAYTEFSTCGDCPSDTRDRRDRRDRDTRRQMPEDKLVAKSDGREIQAVGCRGGCSLAGPLVRLTRQCDMTHESVGRHLLAGGLMHGKSVPRSKPDGPNRASASTTLIYVLPPSPSTEGTAAAMLRDAAEPHLPTSRSSVLLDSYQEAALGTRRDGLGAASHWTLQKRVSVVNKDPRRINQTCRWRWRCPYSPSIGQAVIQPTAASLGRQCPHGLGPTRRCEVSRCPVMTDGQGLACIRILCAYM